MNPIDRLIADDPHARLLRPLPARVMKTETSFECPTKRRFVAVMGNGFTTRGLSTQHSYLDDKTRDLKRSLSKDRDLKSKQRMEMETTLRECEELLQRSDPQLGKGHYTFLEEADIPVVSSKQVLTSSARLGNITIPVVHYGEQSYFNADIFCDATGVCMQQLRIEANHPSSLDEFLRAPPIFDLMVEDNPAIPHIRHYLASVAIAVLLRNADKYMIQTIINKVLYT